MRVRADGIDLDVPDDATPDEIDGIVKEHLSTIGKQNASMVSGTIGPTNRQIRPKAAIDLGQTVRSFAGGFPGSDYAGAAGEWIGDRMPQVLGGVPKGRERTLQEALDDARATRKEAEQTEPLAATGGQVTAGLAMPWSKAKGAVGLLTRAVQGGGLTLANEASRGTDLGQAGTDAGKTAAMSAAIEALLKTPSALRSAAPTLKDWAAKRGWAAGGASALQDVKAASEVVPKGAEPDMVMGAFARDAKLQSGEDLIARGDKPFAIAQKATKFKEELGAAKGAVDDALTAKGVRPDPETMVAKLEERAKALEAPEFVLAYGKGPSEEARAFIDQVKATLGKSQRERMVGVTQQGTGARMPFGAEMADAPRTPMSAEFATVGPEYPIGGAPGAVQPLPGPPPVTTRLKLSQSGGEPVLGAERNTLEGGGGRLIEGTNRPAPGSGWAPAFEEAPTFSQWERAKTHLQQMLHESSAKYGKLSTNITGPTQEMLRDFAAIIRQADEDVVAREAPELLEKFLASKSAFGKSAVLEPMAIAAGQRSQIPPNTNTVGQAAAWASRRSAGGLMGGGGAIGGGLGALTANPLGAWLGAGAGVAAGAAIHKLAHAHPTMTRNWDDLANALAKLPDTQEKAEFAARLAAALRNKEE